ncbi:hypothetical protein NDU88_000385 [Pleurodeles waltl]|uniref:Uncharacterized protein n=1 Tax=Pleurodeles waltl TaxID=8319 RepID=A0AAV7VTB9_PLEWA|nr:hypothetical protein NDU88_000385 [Pleurodeles waltl]
MGVTRAPREPTPRSPLLLPDGGGERCSVRSLPLAPPGGAPVGVPQRAPLLAWVRGGPAAPITGSAAPEPGTSHGEPRRLEGPLQPLKLLLYGRRWQRCGEQRTGLFTRQPEEVGCIGGWLTAAHYQSQ